MTTHSVCQPGRPSPHGDGQLGSSGLATFHSAKSAGWRLLLLPVDLPLAAADQHLVERLVGEEPVVLHRRDVEVHAVLGGVGAADVDQLADHRDHLLDVLGGVGDVGRPVDADAVHRLEPDGLATTGDLVRVPALPVGAGDDLVVDVGDVRHQPHPQA